MSKNLYEAAIREWIAQRIRSRGHKTTRADIRDVSTFDIDSGFHGTDVTPGDEPVAGIKFSWRNSRGYWVNGCAESLDHITPAAFVQECLAIYRELEGGA